MPSQTIPTSAQLADWLAPYGVHVTAELAAKLQIYIGLLQLWNSKIALTAIRDTRAVVEQLFGESFAAVPLLGDAGGRLADVGSGAGFPGLVLKLARPEIQVTLIEPNRKKVVFLEEVIRHLGLTGVTVLPDRVETEITFESKLDWITSRGLAKREMLLDFAQNNLRPAGRLILWVGPDHIRELSETRADGWLWSEPLILPQTKSRFILSGAAR